MLTSGPITESIASLPLYHCLKTPVARAHLADVLEQGLRLVNGEDRRGAPRFPIGIPASLHENGRICERLTTNLSVSGMQIEVNGELTAMFPGRLSAGDPWRVWCRLGLEDDDHVDIDTSLVYCESNGTARQRLGMRFENLGPAQRMWLMELLC